MKTRRFGRDIGMTTTGVVPLYLAFQYYQGQVPGICYQVPATWYANLYCVPA